MELCERDDVVRKKILFQLFIRIQLKLNSIIDIQIHSQDSFGGFSDKYFYFVRKQKG